MSPFLFHICFFWSHLLCFRCATSQPITSSLPYHYSLCTSTPVWRRLPSCPPQWCAPSSPRPRAPWDLSWSCRSRAARRRSASQSWSRSGATASPQSQAASGSDMPRKVLVKLVVQNALGKKLLNYWKLTWATPTLRWSTRAVVRLLAAAKASFLFTWGMISRFWPDSSIQRDILGREQDSTLSQKTEHLLLFLPGHLPPLVLLHKTGQHSPSICLDPIHDLDLHLISGQQISSILW